MPTSVALTPHFESLARELVASGRYNNVSEVVRDGLRLLEKQMAEDAARLKGLRLAAKAGFSAIDRGEFVDVDADEIEAHIDSLARAAAKRAVRASGPR